MTHASNHTSTKLLRKRLDGAAVAEHLNQISVHARSLDIRVKDTATHYSAAAAAQLVEVTQQLVAGNLAGIQVRYQRDGAWWCDTVTRAGDVFRLVRARQVDQPG